MKVNFKYFAIVSLAYCLSANVAQAQETAPVNQRLVNTLEELAGGPHPGKRANHAKGIVLSGNFVASDTAHTVSKAPHFSANTTSPVVVRFSNSSGVPQIHDADPNGLPKGMSIRFMLDGGAHTDVVVISADRFPAATPEGFLGLLTAVKETHAQKGTAGSPSPIEAFLAENPAAKAFVELPKPAPVSFATEDFHGVNAFEFTNANGQKRFGRYLIDPVAGTQYLDEAMREKMGEDYLMNEMSDRLNKGPVAFDIKLQIAGPDDAVNDPTVVWPADREMVNLGRLNINQVKSDGEAYAKQNMFNPLTLVDGIAPSQDAILLARPGAYAISYGRRLSNPE